MRAGGSKSVMTSSNRSPRSKCPIHRERHHRHREDQQAHRALLEEREEQQVEREDREPRDQQQLHVPARLVDIREEQRHRSHDGWHQEKKSHSRQRIGGAEDREGEQPVEDASGDADRKRDLLLGVHVRIIPGPSPRINAAPAATAKRRGRGAARARPRASTCPANEAVRPGLASARASR